MNSDNCVVKTISQLATKLPHSVFGHNYRYFSYKYSIMSHQWYESYNSVHHSIMDYISRNCTDHNYGIMIRDLCHCRDSCVPLKLFSSLNTYVRYRNICNNMHLSLYIKCCIVLLWLCKKNYYSIIYFQF